MDQPFAGIDDLHPNDEVFACGHRPVKIHRQLTGGGMTVLLEHGIGHAAHGLISHQGNTAAVQGMDHVAHSGRCMAQKQVLSPVVIRFQNFHPQLAADRTGRCLIHPGNTPANMLRRRKIICHILPPVNVHQHQFCFIMPQQRKNVNANAL